MRFIDADHLKKWILQRWEKAYPNEDLPTREVLEQIDREISYKMIDIDPQPKWIPVSEKLPKVGVNVLVCDIDNDIYLTHMSPYKSFYDEFCDYIKNVKAWMPLPEPWKGEEE